MNPYIKKINELDLKVIKLQTENDKLRKLLSPRQKRIAENKIIPIDQHPFKRFIHCIVNHCADRFKVPSYMFERQGKDHRVSRARQTAWYLMRLHEDRIQLTEMGRFFGRNWSTVAYGIRKVESVLTKHRQGIALTNDELRQIEAIHSFGRRQ
jgi:chromosomal replication initiation ATPase DnaA